MAGVDTRSPYPGEGRRRGLGFLLNALARDDLHSADGEERKKKDYGLFVQMNGTADAADLMEFLFLRKWELATRSMYFISSKKFMAV
jgi:hypothetical protein